jgi:hypothetical protein
VVPGAVSSDVKRPERETNSSVPFGAEAKTELNYTFSVSHALMAFTGITIRNQSWKTGVTFECVFIM